MARVEEDGTLTLLGRGNTCVNSGGEKVFPEEVEGALKSHPDVFDALVIGMPDDRLGQRVAALVQPRPGAEPDPAALAEQMARLKRVAHKVVWVNPLKASPGYAPLAQGMAAALPYVDVFVEGHSLAALEEVAAVIGE